MQRNWSAWAFPGRWCCWISSMPVLPCASSQSQINWLFGKQAQKRYCRLVQQQYIPRVNLFTWRSGGKHETEEVYNPIKTYYQKAAITLCGTNERRVQAAPRRPGSFSAWRSMWLPARELEMGKSARRLHHNFHLRQEDDNFNKQQSCRSYLPTFPLPSQLKQQPLIPI